MPNTVEATVPSSADIEPSFRSLYPPHLLTASATEKLGYFSRQDLIVDHPILRTTLSRIHSACDPGLDQNTVLLVGPSGVGKTALLRIAVAQQNRLFAAKDERSLIEVPAIFVEADGPERGNFDFKEFYISALNELSAPLVDQTLPLVTRTAGIKTIKTIAPELAGRSPGTGALRSRLRNELALRNTKIMAIDEAVNILKVRSWKNEADKREKIIGQAATVRSLVNKSSSLLILAGAFDFFDLVNYTGQLARRCQTIYFPPYTETADGIKNYTEGLIGLLAHLPARLEVTPREIAKECFLGSFGCIGITRTLLHRWLKKSLDENRPLDKPLLLSCFFTKAAAETMRSEQKEGKERMEDHLQEDSYVNKHLRTTKAEPKATGRDKKARPPKPGQTAPDRRWNGTPPSL